MPLTRTTQVAAVILALLAPPLHAADQPPPAPLAPATFWAFRPVARPEPPHVRDASWPKTPLDRFILSKLESLALQPAPQADKRTLIRRAYFDLIGLPPTPEEVAVFLHDSAPDAFDRVVDRLLASPRYGERWGRHWLDVARYADSNGMDENMAHANAWRYRDWVIAAFNQDKPYDQFVREQIAGDLMPAADNEPETIARRIATGFLSLGPKMLAEDDPVKMQMDIIDEQIDTIGRTFMGIALGCARCHDHKFDPITADDYYALAGIFKSTQTMENFKVVAMWYERPVAPQAEVARWDEHQKRVAEAKAKVEQLVAQANDALLAQARKQAGDYLLAGADLLLHQSTLEQLAIKGSPSILGFAAGSIIVEAETFPRGDVERTFEGYGAGIGVLLSRGAGFAEYDVSVPAEGHYALHLRYAAAESRPVRVSVNGALVSSDAAAGVTGSWDPDGQTWSTVGVASLKTGGNIVRIERNAVFPHIDSLLLVPHPLAKNAAPPPLTADQWAAARALNPHFLRQWAKLVRHTQNDENSPLAAWHELEARLLPPGRREPPLNADAAALLDEAVAASRKALAQRYQQLFDKAIAAGAAAAGDAFNKAAHQLLHDPAGPFALPADVERFYPPETIEPLRKQRDELKTLETTAPAKPAQAMGVTEGPVQNVRVHLRGNHLTLAHEVPRQFPVAFTQGPPSALGNDRSGRLELAHWLTDAKHPLTARVMVNRIWRWHFGTGIVPSPDNLGTTGQPPANQPLLDFLADYFVAHDWSVKAVHRLIMQSVCYQMSVAANPQAEQLDPQNQLLWRANRRRLEAEAIRDTMLSVSGALELTNGGSQLKVANHTYVTDTGTSRVTSEYERPLRSVYLPVVRSALYDEFAAFDFADPSTANGDRATTTVAPQALFMLNSPFVAAQSEKLANRLLSRHDLDDPARIAWAYELAYSRPARDGELQAALRFLHQYHEAWTAKTADRARPLAWRGLCRSLLAANEFLYVE